MIPYTNIDSPEMRSSYLGFPFDQEDLTDEFSGLLAAFLPAMPDPKAPMGMPNEKAGGPESVDTAASLDSALNIAPGKPIGITPVATDREDVKIQIDDPSAFQNLMSGPLPEIKDIPVIMPEIIKPDEQNVSAKNDEPIFLKMPDQKIDALKQDNLDAAIEVKGYNPLDPINSVNQPKTKFEILDQNPAPKADIAVDPASFTNRKEQLSPLPRLFRRIANEMEVSPENEPVIEAIKSEALPAKNESMTVASIDSAGGLRNSSDVRETILDKASASANSKPQAAFETHRSQSPQHFERQHPAQIETAGKVKLITETNPGQIQPEVESALPVSRIKEPQKGTSGIHELTMPEVQARSIENSKLDSQPETSSASRVEDNLANQVLSFLDSEAEVISKIEKEPHILKLRLHPAELGTVEIKLEKSDTGALSARLETETDGAQQILNEQSGQLREALQNSGWQIEKLEIASNSMLFNGNHAREDRPRQLNRADTSNGFGSTTEEECRPESNDPVRLVSLRA